MKIFKRLFSAVLTLIIILSFSTSCFGIIFVPLVPNVAGLPSYTLNEEFVEQAKDYLESARQNTLDNNTTEASVAWSNFNYSYYEIATQTNVAFILYASDSSNKTYKDNYLYANNSYNDIYASYMKALQDIYNAQGSEGVLSGFSEEELNRVLRYTDKVAKLEKEVAELQVEYASLTEDEFNKESVVIYKQIVEKNKQIATEYRFDNYYEYASNYVYDRDQTNGQLNDFRRNVSSKLPSLIVEIKKEFESVKNTLSNGEKNLLSAIMYDSYNSTSINYWEEYLKSYEGNDAKADLSHAFVNQNVMLANGANSRDIAFTAYMPSYKKSFCYFGPNYQDVFTIAHEIGHYFAGMYVPQGSCSMDLKETHSQGNEMLLLEYMSTQLDEKEFKTLELAEISSILTTIVVSTIIDEFEYYVYTNDVSEFTAQDFDNVMNTICLNYGGRTFVDTVVKDINEYWRLVVAEQPLYYVSYAVSGVAALNLYVEANTSRADARNIYVKLIKEHQSDKGYASNLNRAGLVSPFTSEAFTRIEEFVNQLPSV